MEREEVSKITSVLVAIVNSLIAIRFPKATIMTSNSNTYECMSMAWAFEVLNESQAFTIPLRSTGSNRLDTIYAMFMIQKRSHKWVNSMNWKHLSKLKKQNLVVDGGRPL